MGANSEFLTSLMGTKEQLNKSFHKVQEILWLKKK